MGSFDLGRFLFPDVDQGRQPQQPQPLSQRWLSRKLIGAINAPMGNESVTGRVLTLQGTAIRAPIQRGVAQRGNNASYLWAPFSPTVLTFPFTLVYYGTLSRTANSNIPFALGDTGSSSFVSVQASTVANNNKWVLRGTGGSGITERQYSVNNTTIATTPVVLHGVFNSATSIDVYWNGVLDNGTVVSAASSGNLAYNTIALGGLRRGTNIFADTGNDALLGMAFNVALSLQEIQEQVTAIWGVYDTPSGFVFGPVVGGGIIGAGASTQQPNISQGVGTVDSTGAGDSIQQSNVSAGVGIVAVSGAGASTSASDTSASTGTVAITGAGASTQAPNASAAAGTVLASGTGASTQAPNTSVALGTVISGTNGTGASTQQPNASDGVGTAAVSGVGASTQTFNASQGVGTAAAGGAGASTQQPNISGGAGAVDITGTGSGGQSANISAAAGTVGATGFGASIQAPNISVAAGTVISGTTGAGASTQAPNMSRGIGTVSNTYSPGCMRDYLTRITTMSDMIERTATLTPSIERCAQT